MDFLVVSFIYDNEPQKMFVFNTTLHGKTMAEEKFRELIAGSIEEELTEKRYLEALEDGYFERNYWCVAITEAPLCKE